MSSYRCPTNRVVQQSKNTTVVGRSRSLDLATAHPPVAWQPVDLCAVSNLSSTRFEAIRATARRKTHEHKIAGIIIAKISGEQNQGNSSTKATVTTTAATMEVTEQLLMGRPMWACRGMARDTFSISPTMAHANITPPYHNSIASFTSSSLLSSRHRFQARSMLR